MVCSRPSRCPASDFGCRIWSKGTRERKCGPGFALRVFRCTFHKTSFTVYPTGWTPFSRSSYIPKSMDVSSSLYSIFCAASPVAWSKLSLFPGDDFYWTPKTRKRQIHRWFSLLSMELPDDEQAMWEAALTLGCPTQALIDGSNQARAGPTYKGRASAILDVLNQNQMIDSHKILLRGHENLMWGCPIFYDSSSVSNLSCD